MGLYKDFMAYIAPVFQVYKAWHFSSALGAKYRGSNADTKNRVPRKDL